jgi:hypothetical protein
MIGCAAPDVDVEVEQESPYTNEEIIKLEEHEFSKVCQELRQYIAEAEAYAIKLPNFKLHSDFGSFGIYRDAARTDFISLQEIIHEKLLPDASLVLEKCQECRACITNTLSSNPYDKPQSSVEEMEIPTIEQWRDMCLSLRNDLEEAFVTAQGGESRADTLFWEITTDLSSEKWIKDNIVPKFEDSCDRYIDIYSNIIINLENAVTTAEQLKAWGFEALSLSEQPATN